MRDWMEHEFAAAVLSVAVAGPVGGLLLRLASKWVTRKPIRYVEACWVSAGVALVQYAIVRGVGAVAGLPVAVSLGLLGAITVGTLAETGLVAWWFKLRIPRACLVSLTHQGMSLVLAIVVAVPLFAVLAIYSLSAFG